MKFLKRFIASDTVESIAATIAIAAIMLVCIWQFLGVLADHRWLP